VDLEPAVTWLLGFPWLKQTCFRGLYLVLAKRAAPANVLFLNYGWLPAEDESEGLDASQDEVRQVTGEGLYRRVLAGLDLRGRDVLEVSSGHGGGACYIRRELAPRTVIGIDNNSAAIKFCRKHHRMSGLTFQHGDASSLSFERGSLDVVVNVEASHGYSSTPRFFDEVTRVLRPGAHFSFADFRFGGECEKLEQELLATGLELVAKEDLTDGIVRALAASTERTREQIRRLAPRSLQNAVGEFAGLRGSRIYEGFKNRGILYLKYLLRHPTNSPTK
jgi:ubiquinone/menaquinone biosynthesis C-methylase UbiE